MREILVIEDDNNIIALFKHYFKTSININFTYALSYSESLALIASRTFDIYIIDINLEGHSGLDVLRVIQNERNRDIDNRIIVSSVDIDLNSKINSFDLGASNFLSKPISFDLLAAILRKNLRCIESKSAGNLNFPTLLIEFNTRCCFVKMDSKVTQINLTNIEFNILFKLAKSPSTIISKDNLSILGKDPMSFKALEMHIASIRRKIGKERIITSRGIGYYFLAS
jgi:two-component system, OmpR family, response regulator